MLQLIKITEEHKDALFDMMDEWTKTGEKIVPYAIRKNDYHDFPYYISHLDLNDANYVDTTTLFLEDSETKELIGAVNIRHTLNESLLNNVGHIGGGVRPSKRRQGYASLMVELSLKEAKKLGLNRVLLVCDSENTGSRSTILKNGGILEDKRTDNGRINERYWIDISHL